MRFDYLSTLAANLISKKIQVVKKGISHFGGTSRKLKILKDQKELVTLFRSLEAREEKDET